MIHSVTQHSSLVYGEFRRMPISQREAAELPERPANKSSATVADVRIEFRSSSSFGPSTQGQATGVEAYKAVDESTKQDNPYASTILRFIDLQLQRDKVDGATQEELQSRLQAGLGGFMQGYNEAYEQLSASGMLSADVKASVEDTYTRVLDGVAAMAEELGLANPVKDSDRLPGNEGSIRSGGAPAPSSAAGGAVAPPVKPLFDRIPANDQRDLRIIQQLTSRIESMETTKAEKTDSVGGLLKEGYGVGGGYAVGETRKFDFQVRTAEGDKVTVRVAAGKSGAVQFSQGGGVTDLALLGKQSSSLMFSVEGDLSEQELKDINELLQAVGDISSAFFNGEFDQAFDMASNFSLEGDQIQSFSLNLQMTKTEQSTLGQGLYTPKIVDHGAQRSQMEGLASLLEKAGAVADRLQQPRSLVADLLEYAAQQSQSDDPRAALLGPAAKQFL